VDVDFIVTLILILTSLATLGAVAASFGVDTRDPDATRNDHRA
jgi:hypothetical protein